MSISHTELYHRTYPQGTQHRGLGHYPLKLEERWLCPTAGVLWYTLVFILTSSVLFLSLLVQRIASAVAQSLPEWRDFISELRWSGHITKVASLPIWGPSRMCWWGQWEDSVVSLKWYFVSMCTLLFTLKHLFSIPLVLSLLHFYCLFFFPLNFNPQCLLPFLRKQQERTPVSMEGARTWACLFYFFLSPT